MPMACHNSSIIAEYLSGNLCSAFRAGIRLHGPHSVWTAEIIEKFPINTDVVTITP